MTLYMVTISCDILNRVMRKHIFVLKIIKIFSEKI